MFKEGFSTDLIFSNFGVNSKVRQYWLIHSIFTFSLADDRYCLKHRKMSWLLFQIPLLIITIFVITITIIFINL